MNTDKVKKRNLDAEILSYLETVDSLYETLVANADGAYDDTDLRKKIAAIESDYLTKKTASSSYAPKKTTYTKTETDAAIKNAKEEIIADLDGAIADRMDVDLAGYVEKATGVVSKQMLSTELQQQLHNLETRIAALEKK